MTVVEMSSVAETFIKSLAISRDDLEIKLKILKVLKKLSANSGKTITRFVYGGNYCIPILMNFTYKPAFWLSASRLVDQVPYSVWSNQSGDSNW